MFPAKPEPVRPENLDPEDPGAGGAHDPMRDDAEELMVPRVPSLLLEPSAKTDRDMQYAEAGVTSAQRRRVERTHTLPERKERCPKVAQLVASLVVTEKMCFRSCVSNAETVKLDAWERQLLTGRVRRTTRVRT